MKHSAGKISLFLVASTIVAVGIPGCRMSRTQASSSNGNAYGHDPIGYESSAQDMMDRMCEIVVHGMEPRTGGFHVIQPPLNPDNYSLSFLDSFPVTFGRWAFTSVPPLFPNAFVGLLDLNGRPYDDYTGTPPIHVSVSNDRVFDNGFGELSKVQNGAAWDVFVTFNDAALEELQIVHGSLRGVGTPHFDWFDSYKADGDFATEMMIALVVDGIALLPFSATALIGLRGPQTILVAEQLLEADADNFIRYYNN